MSVKKIDSSYIVVLVTTSIGEEAHKIADRLLNERKAACVSIVPGVSSFFRWQDECDSARENLLIIKTKAELLNEIIDLVKQLHSYEVPEILALPIAGGNPDYLEWLNKAVE